MQRPTTPRLPALAVLSRVSYLRQQLQGSTDWGSVARVVADTPGVHPAVLGMVRGLAGTAIRAWYRNEHDLACMLVADHRLERLTIVFAGTDSVHDWGTNLRVWKSVLPAGDPRQPVFVHSGFLRQLLGGGVQARLARDVAVLVERHPGWAWEVCGHSLGGALAVLSASLLAVQFPGVHWGVATFGAPRVGDRGFAAFVDGLPNLVHHRVSNGRDPVVCTPKVNYHHSGRSRWIAGHGDVRWSEPPAAALHSLGDHHIDSYCRALGPAPSRL